MLVESQKVWV